MSRPRSDRALRATLGVLATVSAGVVLVVVWNLFEGALPALEGGALPSLFLDESWQPGSQRDPQFGIVTMLVGSFFVTLLATVLAAPLGIAGAVFHRFYLPACLAAWNRRLLELLAGVPSVVFGFWGLMVLVPAINRIHPPGQSLLAGGIVLALMILPTIALTSQAALAAVPRFQLLGAAGLGMGRAGTIVHIALPAARRGIGSGVLLAVARAVGETMAVVLVCGNIPQFPKSVFDPVRPVTSTLALEMSYAALSHKSLLYATGLILVLLTGLLVAGWSFRKETHRSVED